MPGTTEPCADLIGRLLEAGLGPTLLLDRQGRVLEANRKARRLLGRPAEREGPWRLGETLAGPLERALGRACRERRATRIMLTAAGGRRLRVRLVPAARAATSAATFLAFVEPLAKSSPRRPSRHRRRADESPYGRIAHELPVPWALKGDGLEVVDCNRAFLDKLGTSAVALLGRHIDVAVPVGLAHELEIHDRVALERATTTRIDHVLELAAGERQILRLTRVPLGPRGGMRASLLVVVDDVTDRLRAGDGLAGDGSLVQAILDYMPGMIALKDAHTRRFLFATGTDRVLEGGAPGTLVGRTAAEVYEPELAAGIDASEDRLLAGPSQVVDKRFPHLVAGQMHWFFSRKLVVPDADGTPRYILTFNLDITREVEAEQGLGRTTRFLDALLDTTPALLSVKDVATRRYVRVNHTFCRVMGVAPEQILDRSVVDLDVEDAALHDAADSRLVASDGEPSEQVYETTTVLGRRWLKARKALVRDEGGRPTHILTLADDITDRVVAQQRLAASRTFLSSIVQHLPWPLAVQEAETGRFVLANLATQDGGLAPHPTLLGKRARDVFARAYAERMEELDRQLLATGAGRVDEEIVDPGRQPAEWHHVRKAVIPDESGNGRYILTIDEDISDRRRMLEELSRSEASLRRSQSIARIGSWRREADGGRIEWSEEMYRLLGVDRAGGSLSLKGIVRQILPEDRQRLRVLGRLALLAGAERQSVVVRARRGDGLIRYLNIDAEIEPAADGRLAALIGTCQDVTERIETERNIYHLAHHDALTGLPNRLLFDDRLGAAVAAAQRQGSSLALLCLDLNDFKGVNDTLGHATGDDLLRHVATRLRGLVRESDLVARLGGDEFAVIQHEASRTGTAATLASRLIDGLSSPFRINGQELFTSCSVGIAMLSSPPTNPAELLRQADMALYEAKAAGRGSFRFFSPDMNAHFQERKLIESRLRNAVASGALSLAFQPQVALATGELVGVEALLRWHDGELGQVSPDRFIPVAEETAQILQLGEFVLREACAQARAWHDAGVQVARIAVNLSPAQFAYQDLVLMVTQILRETGLAAASLELEITESMLMRDRSAAVSTLEALHALGINIALDDFGTGYSSLSYLKRFPLDKIKIDRSFVADLPHDPDDVAIVRTILSLGRTLGLRVVAEGVETEAQRDFLVREGCDEAQGFFFARPTTAADLPAALGRRSPRQQPADPRPATPIGNAGLEPTTDR